MIARLFIDPYKNYGDTMLTILLITSAIVITFIALRGNTVLKAVSLAYVTLP